MGRWRALMLVCGMLMMPAQAAESERARSSDGEALAYFVDGFMQHAVVSGKTVGATLALIRDGRLIAAKGYGLADIAQSRQVRAATTQFRIGSISKVLVWIAVLQQVEAGRLHLETDVNEYLTRFKMPPDFTAPITLRHLMTHTAGLEDDFVNLFVTGPRQVGGLGETLAANVPRRVHLPGSLVAYSNYGAALAAYLVTQVSGMQWDDYVDAHIFKPLGMRDSTTRQPVPEHMETSRAKGYIPVGGDVEEQAFSFIPLATAGAASATAVDVAKLMAELLNPAGSRVLSAASKAQLRAGAYVVDPRVNGMALGLYEMSLGDVRALGHEGSTVLFNARMVFWPAHDIGLFVATNTMGGQSVATDLFELVADQLGLSGHSVPLADVAEGDTYSGFYVTARRNYSNFSKLMALADVARVDFDTATSSLMITDIHGIHRYRQVDRQVFQQHNGTTRVVFKPSPDGSQALYFSNRPMSAYIPAAAPETPMFNLGVWLSWVALGLGVVLVWPVSSSTHRRHDVVPGQRLLALLCYFGCLLVGLFIVRVAGLADNGYQLVLHGFKELPALLWMPVVYAGLVLLQLLYGVRVWAQGFWWPSRRLHFTLFLLVQCALVWWFWYWNLLPEVLLEYLK